MTVFAELNQFEFVENVERRQITLITHNERTTLQFPANYPEEQFVATYDFFLDYTPTELHKVMGQVAKQIPGSLLIGELKPGAVHDHRHKPDWFFSKKKNKYINADKWYDGLSYEDWCEQVPGKMYQGRKHTGINLSTGDGSEYVPFKSIENNSVAPRVLDDDDQSLGDMLNELFG